MSQTNIDTLNTITTTLDLTGYSRKVVFERLVYKCKIFLRHGVVIQPLVAVPFSDILGFTILWKNK